MIVQPVPTTLRHRLFAGGLLSVLALLTLTSASSTSGSEEPARKQEKKIDVAHCREMPTWERKLRDRLVLPVVPLAGRKESDEHLDRLREQVGLDFVVDPESTDLGVYGEYEILGGEQAAQSVLEQICRRAEVSWSPERGVLWISSEPLPSSFEKRIYRVRELFEAHQAEVGDFRPDHLVDIIRTHVGYPRVWEQDESRIEAWRSILVVNQRYEVHEELERFLNRLWNRGHPTPEAPVWKERVQGLLAKKVSIDIQDGTILHFQKFFEQQGLQVRLEEDEVDLDQPLSLRVRKIPMGDVLALGARLTRLPVSFDRGVLLIGRAPRPVLRFYDLSRILADAAKGQERYEGEEDDEDHRVEMIDRIEHTLRSQICVSWEEEGRGITWWGNQMLVRQVEAGQVEVAEILAALEQVLVR